MNTLARGLVAYNSNNGSLPKAAINAAVQAQYAHIPGDAGKYQQLAADLNAAPLYTLFEPASTPCQRTLTRTSTTTASRSTTTTCLPGSAGPGNPGFNAALQGMNGRGANGVIPREAFLQALTVALLPSTTAGPGNPPSINFDTADKDKNHHADPGFRPPAIGLAHELMHAWHYTRGTSPGLDYNDYSTTAAELRFTGIGPLAIDPVSQNIVRGQWAGVPGPDRRHLAHPVQRLVYNPSRRARPSPRCASATVASSPSEDLCHCKTSRMGAKPDP